MSGISNRNPIPIISANKEKKMIKSIAFTTINEGMNAREVGDGTAWRRAALNNDGDKEKLCLF